MSFSINQLPVEVTKIGIKTGVSISGNDKYAKLQIYAAPCSASTFRFTYLDFDGVTYRYDIDDTLPIEDFTLDLENPIEMSKLAHLVKEKGMRYSGSSTHKGISTNWKI
tara:strand:- start:847 stop:1173 length:327 start_codon:yes stop_codon:yes gene_type:complete